ncbi:c-type cytochrome [Novosphingobium sp. Fuku2-ISO-50]|uniref:c-type cytochrome n=1 Tax=Novosphingobium sp. Fuku2-ISO-50 TaxID=1739114 RepID=UPI00076CC8A8|nr:c-type cytochrome [Novosphingobium sp. Fuku2-ISO-50]KUR76724.1 cystathionine gamma-synthase [Novosphingobium sp. Fuku2-ISO-50]
MSALKAFHLGLGLVALVAGGGAMHMVQDGKAAAATPSSTVVEPAPWAVPDIASLPDDEWGRTVRKGQDLVMKTAALIGPGAPDPARRYAGSGLDCQSCHVDGGRKKFGLPLVGAFAAYPSYRPRSGKVGTIEERVNGCMTRSLNGKPLPEGGAEMTAIVAYLKFLSTGRPVGVMTEGRGPGHMPELARAADPIRGQQVFAGQCAACHGEHGEGQSAGAGEPGYVIPPLWGPNSFNDGAGMARLTNAANFIHNNMPNGTTWTDPALSVTDAWDVAAYIEAQPRPHKADLDRDFPNRREKPVDAAYGPYADGFPASQHKFGPYAPIRAAIDALVARH